MVTRTEVVVVAGDSLTRVAYKVEVSSEIACCDGCICKVAVLCLREERIVLVRTLCAVAASVRVAYELDVSALASCSLEDLAFADEGVNCEFSLLAFSSLLKDDFVLTLAKSLSQNDESVFCSNKELSVSCRCHLLVSPEVEPAVLGV